jgi:hypothetical protein
MANALTVVEKFEEKTGIKFVINIETQVNDMLPKNSCLRPHYNSMLRLNDRSHEYKESEIFFSRFTYPPVKNMPQSKKIIILDNCFTELIKKSDDLPQLKKFICFRTESFDPKNIPHNLDSLHYKVEYAEIRESVISFLLQTGETKLGKELQEEFKKISPRQKDGIVNKKVKELLGLNLEDYFSNVPKKNTILNSRKTDGRF